MYLQEIFEVILGLIFVWLILSIGTMQIQEWLAGILGTRGNTLYDGIRKMLGDKDLVDLFYAHPIIASLSDFQSGRKRKPSYISAENFSNALLSIILDASTEASLILLRLYDLRHKLGKIKSKEIRRHAEAALDRLFEIARLAVSSETGKPFGNLVLMTLEKDLTEFGGQYVEIEGDVQELLKWTRTKKDQIDQAASKVFATQKEPSESHDLFRGLLALRVVSPDLNLALNSLLVGAGEPTQAGEDYLQIIRQQIENWFNETMERLSGWYKRSTQFITFGIGLLVAILFNIDSIHMSNYLWREPTLRQAIVARINDNMLPSAETNTPDLAGAISLIQQELMGMSLPVGWTFVAVPAGLSCRFVPSAAEAFGIPWLGQCIRPAGVLPSTNGWLWAITKLTGWLISGIAASQGSSFWFDILSKIVNVRTAGTKPQG